MSDKGVRKKPPVERCKKGDRRCFLRTALLGLGVLTAVAIGYVPVLMNFRSRLRPPGALEEHSFLASCIKCGQCEQVCPVKAVKLGDIDEGYGIGVPHIDARQQACDFSCDAVQCVLACPTGALTHKISKKEEVRMGLARLARPDACLARQGKGFKGQTRGADFDGLHRYSEIDRWKPVMLKDHPYDLPICDLCVRECPIKDAIVLEPMESGDGVKHMTPKVQKACVGCGMCQMVCPVDDPCIVVDERKMWSEA